LHDFPPDRLGTSDDRSHLITGDATAATWHCASSPEPQAISTRWPWLQTQTADDMDQRWRALARKAELGGAIGTELALPLDRDPDPDAWVPGLAVRAAAPDADEKMAVWQTLVVDRAVPIGSARQIATAFWRPGQHDLRSPYAKRYLDLVPNLDRGGMIPAMAFTSLLFPVFAIDQTFFARAQGSAEQAAPVVRKTLTERSDVVGRMLRSRD
jgi:aminopeptidase N